jgi:hypothetical protein
MGCGVRFFSVDLCGSNRILTLTKKTANLRRQFFKFECLPILNSGPDQSFHYSAEIKRGITMQKGHPAEKSEEGISVRLFWLLWSREVLPT